MSGAQLMYLVPYFLSFAFSVWIAHYAWRHRHMQGARAYGWLILTQTVMTFGFILELLSPHLGDKLFWDKFQWIATALASIAVVYFAIQYTEFKIPSSILFWSLVASVPILFILGVLTDPIHHLIYPDPRLRLEFIFVELQYGLTLPIYILAIHAYAVVLFSFGLLLRRFSRSPKLYRTQVIAIILGLLLPIISTVLTLLDIRITPLRDSTPITTAIGNLIIAWGIFRYRLLDIVHIARDKMIENMSDLVFVLDEQDRIIDINPSALRLLNMTPSQAIGKPAMHIFAEWPAVLDKFEEPANANLEVIVTRESRYLHFDVKSTLLYDNRGNYQGRVFVARDITPYASLQWELRTLNEHLERRVQTRTEELAEAYDTTLEGWARALELRDKETEGHSWRVTETTMKLALAVGVPHEEFEHIRRGAILHDIGKMAVPDEILRKTGPLNESERNIILQHPSIAHQLLSRIPFLQKALDIPYCHHEKWDGTGYPRGLKGKEIPLAARIFAIVDVWDAIQSDRPYKKAWSREQAILHMQEQAGKYFDPELVDVFLQMAHEGKI